MLPSASELRVVDSDALQVTSGHSMATLLQSPRAALRAPRTLERSLTVVSADSTPGRFRDTCPPEVPLALAVLTGVAILVGAGAPDTSDGKCARRRPQHSDRSTVTAPLSRCHGIQVDETRAERCDADVARA
jgi:hypothetical protein